MNTINTSLKFQSAMKESDTFKMLILGFGQMLMAPQSLLATGISISPLLSRKMLLTASCALQLIQFGQINGTTYPAIGLANQHTSAVVSKQLVEDICTGIIIHYLVMFCATPDFCILLRPSLFL